MNQHVGEGTVMNHPEMGRLEVLSLKVVIDSTYHADGPTTRKPDIIARISDGSGIVKYMNLEELYAVMLVSG